MGVSSFIIKIKFSTPIYYMFFFSFVTFSDDGQIFFRIFTGQDFLSAMGCRYCAILPGFGIKDTFSYKHYIINA